MTTTISPTTPPESPPGEPQRNRLAPVGALTRLLEPVRDHLVGCAALSAAASACGVVPYIAVAEIARTILDRGLANSSPTVWTWAMIGALGAALRLLLVYGSSRLGHFADAKLLHELRVRMVRHLGSLPLGWFRTSGSAQVNKRMTNDLEEMHQLIAHALGEMVGAVVSVVIGVTYLVFVDLTLTAVAVGALALLGISYRVAMRSMTGHMERLLAAEARIGAAGVEFADGIAVVKAAGTGGRIQQRFDEAITEHARALAAWANETRYSTAFARLLASELTLLAVLGGAGIALVYTDSASMADVLPFFIVGVGLPTAINPAIHGSQGLRKGRSAAQNIESLLTRTPLPETTTPQMPNGSRVELDRVTFSYDGRSPALDAVTAVCEPGTVTAVVGPSGAGKSTLASLIPRFYDVTHGAIRIGGVDIREMSSSALLALLSLVFQDVALLRDTVAENIRIGAPGADDEAVRNAARAARIHEVIEALPLGYGTVLGDGADLSGGERQRLTIARAIISEAPIVVLDEATASLDPDSETAVQQALSSLVQDKTVIVIAHRLHTIATADQILVLDAGRITERGTHAELLRLDGLYARMWRTQHNEGGR